MSRSSIPVPTTRPTHPRCSTPCAAKPSRTSSSPTPTATIRRTPRGIKAATGATVYAEGPHRASRPYYESEKISTESGADRDFRPDVQVSDGETIAGDGWALQAVATPGHTANHMAFAWPERKLTFIGDHVMGWSTSIVAPPDGSMVDYMASLQKLTQRDEDLYFSGHGPEIPDARRYVRFLIRHREAREASILHRLAKGEADIPTMVRAIYIGIDPRLTGAAGYSVLAHLEDLVGRGIVATDGDPVIGGSYRLAHRLVIPGCALLGADPESRSASLPLIPGSREDARPGMTTCQSTSSPRPSPEP